MAKKSSFAFNKGDAVEFKSKDTLYKGNISEFLGIAKDSCFVKTEVAFWLVPVSQLKSIKNQISKKNGATEKTMENS